MVKSSATLHCVLIDCSGSMMRGEQLAWAKGLLVTLSEQLYQHRQRLTVIGFGGHCAQLLHAPQKTRASNIQWIDAIPAGGGSPAVEASRMASQLLKEQHKMHPEQRHVLWLLSDGRYDPLPALPHSVDECHLVDFESGSLTLGRVRRLADLWQANYMHASHWVSSAVTYKARELPEISR